MNSLFTPTLFEITKRDEFTSQLTRFTRDKFTSQLSIKELRYSDLTSIGIDKSVQKPDTDISPGQYRVCPPPAYNIS